MKVLMQFLLLGLLLSIAQSALAMFFPPYLCPDFGLLLAAGMGYRLRAARGLIAAALLGYIVDYFSGTLFGEHSVIYTAVFFLMHLGNRQVHIRGPLRKALALAVLTFLQGLAFMWMASQLRADNLLPIAIDGGWWLQALVNAAAAPWVLGWILRLTAERDSDSTLQAPGGFGVRGAAR